MHKRPAATYSRKVAASDSASNAFDTMMVQASPPPLQPSDQTPQDRSPSTQSHRSYSTGRAVVPTASETTRAPLNPTTVDQAQTRAIAARPSTATSSSPLRSTQQRSLRASTSDSTSQSSLQQPAKANSTRPSSSVDEAEEASSSSSSATARPLLTAPRPGRRSLALTPPRDSVSATGGAIPVIKRNPFSGRSAPLPTTRAKEATLAAAPSAFDFDDDDDPATKPLKRTASPARRVPNSVLPAASTSASSSSSPIDAKPPRIAEAVNTKALSSSFRTSPRTRSPPVEQGSPARETLTVAVPRASAARRQLAASTQASALSTLQQPPITTGTTLGRSMSATTTTAAPASAVEPVPARASPSRTGLSKQSSPSSSPARKPPVAASTANPARPTTKRPTEKRTLADTVTLQPKRVRVEDPFDDLESPDMSLALTGSLASRQAGENQQLRDDLEYMLEGLGSAQPPGVRCKSMCTLAEQAASQDFQLHFRALGTLSRVCRMLSDAPQHADLAICTAGFLAVFTRDSAVLDASSDLLKLALALLETALAPKPIANQSLAASSSSSSSLTPRMRATVAAMLATIPQLLPEHRSGSLLLPIVLVVLRSIATCRNIESVRRHLLASTPLLAQVASVFVQQQRHLQSQQTRLLFPQAGGEETSPAAAATLWTMQECMTILSDLTVAATPETQLRLVVAPTPETDPQSQASSTSSSSSSAEAIHPSALLVSIVDFWAWLLEQINEPLADVKGPGSTAPKKHQSRAAPLPALPATTTRRMLPSSCTNISVSALRVLMNATNNQSEACLAVAAASPGLAVITETALVLASHVVEDSGSATTSRVAGGVAHHNHITHDVRVYGLGLLVNLTEHTWSNRQAIGVLSLSKAQVRGLAPTFATSQHEEPAKNSAHLFDLATSEHLPISQAVFLQLVHRQPQPTVPSTPTTPTAGAPTSSGTASATTRGRRKATTTPPAAAAAAPPTAAPPAVSQPPELDEQSETDRNITGAYAALFLGCLVRDHDFNRALLQRAFPSEDCWAQMVHLLAGFVEYQRALGIVLSDETCACIADVMDVFVPGAGTELRGTTDRHTSTNTGQGVYSSQHEPLSTPLNSDLSSAVPMALEPPQGASGFTQPPASNEASAPIESDSDDDDDGQEPDWLQQTRVKVRSSQS
ncbi:hypothetical protein CAOG_000797 [Capsaspora owczarzaki ATCC 30864]|uniref:WAPL domain-containing protein n=2 Tax=Capsaspora owczarzaki (strain ATCC 30864) TaxID=595528 RepID=A0A0D2VH79_CAPO3|nr:hypothetical protein CAOG_000797 [Capsaspora owczarzaki ATCC 30864]